MSPEQISIEEHWENFRKADSPNSFYESWLSIQCHLVSDVTGGLVLLGEADTGPFSPVATWPSKSTDLQYLIKVAENTLIERKVITHLVSTHNPETREVNAWHIGYPIFVGNTLHGVLALELININRNELNKRLQNLYWGSAWLELMLIREEESNWSQLKHRLVQVLDLVALTLDKENFQTAAMSIVTEVATRLECDRVSLGTLQKNHMQVTAISHSAKFSTKTKLLRSIGACMDESLDQRESLCFPPTQSANNLIMHAHELHAKSEHDSCIFTIPLYQSNRLIKGALTFERQESAVFTAEEIESFQTLASLIGPLLILQKENDQSLLSRIHLTFNNFIQGLLGPKHLTLKFFTLIFSVFGLFLFFSTGDYEVSAKTKLEGAVMRAIVAPFDGYINIANLRAGDIVTSDQVIAELDNNDFLLEKNKWLSRKDQLTGQYREAMANHERAQSKMLIEQINQAKAELDLLKYQIARTSIRAPIDGIIVSGDLTQSLGAPVARGDTLFEIAPLNDYRIVIEVDERDITHVSPQLTGSLALSGIPDQNLRFDIKKIMPVTVSAEGRNFFRVEGVLIDHNSRLRPGMEGIARISIDQRNLFWIWTHKIHDWLRLWFWQWWP